MLLRTSSAPVAHSLFLNSPDRDLDTGITSTNKLTNANEHSTKKISFGHGLRHLCSVSCQSSAVCSSTNICPNGKTIGRRTIRRAHSDGNLEGLASLTTSDLEGIYGSIMLMSKSLNDLQQSMLQTEPSFSIYGIDGKFEEEVELDSLEGMKMDTDGKLERTATIGESIDAQFCFGWNGMQIIKEDDDEEEDTEEEEDKVTSVNKFTGLSCEIQGECTDHTIYIGTGPDGAIAEIGGDGSLDLDKYYNKMLLDNPSNPLVLRNYAQYLESKRNFAGAEEYYSRATLADPCDGEIMTQYAKANAKLLWEVQGDQVRASTYFRRATVAAPDDCNVLAAYTNFLWNTDEGEEDAEECLSNTEVDKKPSLVDRPTRVFKDEARPSSPPLHLAMGLGIDNPAFSGIENAVDYLNICSDDSGTVEKYYKRMIEENPYNPLFLGNYAQFLHQSKGDLEGAEEYYSRAIREDPNDGQLLSLYAGVLWQLHGDNHRAASYFELAIHATPKDCNVLAAYAKFLWESEAEDDVVEQAPNPMPAPIRAAAAINA